MALSLQQRRELASFLKRRRERLSPKEAGIDQTYGRRRTPGLRREELAALAGVGLTWYTWMEQARSIKVSRDVLLGLARALQLDRAETIHMFKLAGELPPSAASPCTRDELEEIYLALLDRLDPLPAAILNNDFDVLAWNHGFCVLYPFFESLSPPDRNSLVMLFDSRSRELHTEWHEEAMGAVARFRSEAVNRFDEPTYRQLYDRLNDLSPTFRDFWQLADVAQPTPTRRGFHHDALGSFQLEELRLRLPDVEATLVINMPVSDNGLMERFQEHVLRHGEPGRPDSTRGEGRAQGPDPVP